MPVIQLPNNWTPRDYQIPLWEYLQNGGKRAVAVWHRRAGKDDVFLHHAARCAWREPATYWHMLPEAAQARKAIWEAINPHTGKRRIDEAFPVELRASTRENDMMIKLKSGGSWQVVGSDNYNSLVGSPPKGVTFSEWPLAKQQAWAFLRPILKENNGWAAFIYTPRGYNHGHTLYEMAQNQPGWFSQKLTVEDTGVFTPHQLAEELIELQKEWGIKQGEALFNQEYFCSFDAAIIGSVYGSWLETCQQQRRVLTPEKMIIPPSEDFPEGMQFSGLWNPDYPVYTAWDLGRSDYCSIWFFQVMGGELRIIDFYENNLEDPPHYAKVIHAKPYGYGENTPHFVPHDARHKLFAAGGRSLVEWFYELRVKARVVASTSVQNSITAARKTLQQAVFDKTCCKEGFEHLRQYHYHYNENLRTMSDAPVHDDHSHASNAFELLARIWKTDIIPNEKPAPRFLHEATADEVFWPAKTGSLHSSNYERI